MLLFQHIKAVRALQSMTAFHLLTAVLEGAYGGYEKSVATDEAHFFRFVTA